VKAGPLCVAHCVLYVLSSFTCPSRKNPNPNLPTSNSVYIRRARAQTFKHLVLQTVALARGSLAPRNICFSPTRTFCAVSLCERRLREGLNVARSENEGKTKTEAAPLQSKSTVDTLPFR